MRKRSLFAVLMSSLSVAALAIGATGTWTGKITDSMCNKDHSMMASGGKQPDSKQCTLDCVKGGAKFVFVTGDKMYEIANQDLPALKTYAGAAVKLTGEIQSDGKTIKADKIQAAR